ncbi:MAG: protein translocase subunit SecD [Lysobacteraceae bacterium]
MLDFPRWKYAVVILVVIFGFIYAMPNLYPQDPAVQISPNRGAALDEALVERVGRTLTAAGIDYRSVAIEGESVLVRLEDAARQMPAQDLLRTELGTDYTTALNLAQTIPDWMAAIRATPLQLGLDLRGGVHFLMEVDEQAALERQETAYADQIREALTRADLSVVSVERGSTGIDIRMRDPAEAGRARTLLGREAPQLIVEQISSGEDGLRLRAVIAEAEIREVIDRALDQNIGTLRNRIDEVGVAEPIITRQGTNRIVVQLPGVQDTAQAKSILGRTATLEYRAVFGDQSDAFEAARTGRVPPEARLYYQRTLGPDGNPLPILLSRRIIASGDQLIHATSRLDSDSGTPSVSVTLDGAGAQRMLEFTRDNVGRGMAVVFIERIPEVRIVNGEERRTVRVSEEVISVATIRGVFGRNFQTTGLGSMREAADLALFLRSGALAAPVDIVEERVVGPTLGQENIDAGVMAITMGFLMVCALMIAYYKVFGVVAVLALFTNLLLIAAVLSMVNATLTMPGIAGIVLTLGMAVDGNVLVGERIREELRLGNTPANAIKGGYERAWVVILDSNVTKLIAAIALFSFGSGPVRGFAVVLFVGVLTSMFTSVTVSRALLTVIYGRRKKLQAVSV